MDLTRICVYCGTSATRDAFVEKEVKTFGQELAKRGITLVYGGSSLGMMGVLADEVIAAGGKVIGVIPEALVGREAAHKKVELKVVNTMHDRDQTMFDLGDAFVALPGGFGTLDQVLEMITWKQLGIHGKPAVRERDPDGIRAAGTPDPLRRRRQHPGDLHFPGGRAGHVPAAGGLGLTGT